MTKRAPEYTEYSIVLYKNSKDYDYNLILFNIMAKCPEYEYITHKNEKDIYGDTIQEHIHCYFKFETHCTHSAMHKRIDFPVLFVDRDYLKQEIVADTDAALLYLLHRDTNLKVLEGKEPYQIEDLTGTCTDYISALLLGKKISTTAKIYQIKQFITRRDYVASYNGTFDYVMSIDGIKTYNQYYKIFADLIKENRDRFFNEYHAKKESDEYEVQG